MSNVSPTAYTMPNTAAGAYAASNVPAAYMTSNAAPNAYGSMPQASQTAVWPDWMQTASYYPWSQMTDSSQPWMLPAHEGSKQSAKDTKEKRTSSHQDTLSTEEQEA